MSAPSPALETAAPRAHPASPLALFIAFTLLALQGFGGVLAVAQRELVDRRGWLTPPEFVELYAVSYPHMTLPTIYSVYLFAVLGSL